MMVLSVCIVCLISIFVSIIVNMYSFLGSAKREKNDKHSVFVVNERELIENGKCAITGYWEYFDGLHIISDGNEAVIPDKLVELPMRWSLFNRDFWGKDGKASYKITIKNLPIHENIFCLYGISPTVEVFVNGEKQNSNYSFGRALQEASLRYMESCEIVLEVSSSWLTGLYAGPWIYQNSEFQRDMNIANSIWMISLGAFTTAFLLCTVLLRKYRTRKLFRGFFVSFIGIALFYIFASNETTTKFSAVYEYVPFEQMHLFVTTIATLSGYSTVRLQGMLFPDVYEKKFAYLLSGSLYAAIFLRLIFDMYFDVDVVICCFLAILIVYEIACTILGFIKAGWGIVFVSGATIMVNIAVSIAAMGSAKYFLEGINIILPSSLLFAVLLYANFWALEFAKIEEAASNEGLAKKRMMDAEIAFLTSQVQPHFQYNTLTMIQELCYTDPEKAAQAIVMFSSLLRRKVDFQKYDKLVPFCSELENIKEYVAIQKLRFNDSIEFLFNIEFDDFEVPPLSIQTLMENAVHHGLRKRPDCGFLKLSTMLRNDTVVICVEDNGVGFNQDTVTTGSIGGGLENCRLRIENLLNGTLYIESAISHGTCIKILIPHKNGKNHHH